MIRPSAARRDRRAATQRSASIPAPVGGWNARDAIANMEPTDAIRLDNWFPSVSYVELRKGHAGFADGLGAAVESLMPYAGMNADKLFAAADSSIWDVTNGGTIGSAAVTGMTNDRWQHVNFAVSGNSYLIAVNGADDGRLYDGSNWGTVSWTGVSSSSIANIEVFKHRLILIEAASLSFWYLPVDSVSGTASEFDLGPYCRLGGYLMAVGTWTRDGGDGLDDFAVFITSRGEALIFQGDDPGDANAWSLVGVFNIGSPLGRRCMIKVGPELILLTQDGFVPLSQVITTARSTERVYLSDKISGAVQEAVRNYAAAFGWQGCFYPRGTMLIFNVPVSTASQQYVANTTTGAWCRFTGMDANCWCVWKDDLYFGGDGEVFQADTTDGDDGANIEAFGRPAFNYFRQPGRLKKFNMVRPILGANGTLGLVMNINVDFDDTAPSGTPTFSDLSGAVWDEAVWDVADWGGVDIIRDWQSVAGLGYSATVNLKVASNVLRIQWYSTDWLYEPGGYI